MLTPVPWSVDLVEVPALAFAGFWLATQMLLALGRGIEPVAGVLLLSHLAAIAVGVGVAKLAGRKSHTWN